MSMKSKVRRPPSRRVDTPPDGARPEDTSPVPVETLPLPHERDQSTDATAEAPDPVIVQAKNDLDAGLVDTDMRATAGLDAERRKRLVPGPGGESPSTKGST